MAKHILNEPKNKTIYKFGKPVSDGLDFNNIQASAASNALRFVPATYENIIKYNCGKLLHVRPDDNYTAIILANKYDELVGYGYIDDGFKHNVHLEPEYKNSGCATYIMDKLNDMLMPKIDNDELDQNVREDILNVRPFNTNEFEIVKAKDGTEHTIVKYKEKLTRIRAAMLVINGDQVLLCRDEHNNLSLPGGGIEKDESIIDAAKREVEEEVRITVKNVIDTNIDYCECHNSVAAWVRENVPEDKWWYNYYTCLTIGEVSGRYSGHIDEVDKDSLALSTMQFYDISYALTMPGFKTPWKEALIKNNYIPKENYLDDKSFYIPADKLYESEANEITTYHWSPNNFDKIQGNEQGIHLATNVRTCRDIAKNRNVDYDNGYLYKITLSKNKLKAAHFDIDPMDWSTEIITDLLIGKIANDPSKIYGATNDNYEEIQDDGSTKLMNWHDENDADKIKINNLNRSNLDELAKLQELDKAASKNHDREMRKLVFTKLGKFFNKLGYNCISYNNYGENGFGDLCYILFDSVLINNEENLGKCNQINNRMLTENVIEDSKKRIEKLLHVDYETAIEDIMATIYNICEDNDINISITGLEFTGSQRFGEPKDNSDLDIVFTYNSKDISEDSLFNILAEEHISYAGFKLDFNPIEDGDINEYIKRASQYRKQLTEETRTVQIGKSRNAGLYKDQSFGKNRFERRKYSKVSSTVKQYNTIDMNEFFKHDELNVNVPIAGETDNYEVTIKLIGVLAEIAKNIKSNNNKLEFRTILQALSKVFNSGDIYTNCTCPDYKYTFLHHGIQDKTAVKDTASDPGPGKGIRNPHNDKGRGCKHILAVINNLDWLMKVTSVIKNYIFYMEEHNTQLFNKIIFPKLYGETVEAAVEDNLIPEDTKLDSEKHIIEVINDWARNRGKFRKGENKNPVKYNKK